MRNYGKLVRRRRVEASHQPVGRVEHSGLRIGQKGRTHKQELIPEGQSCTAQGLGAVLPVRVLVQQYITAGEDEIGKCKLPQK